MRDPRVFRPAIAIGLGYLAWALLAVTVRITGLGDQSEPQKWLAVALMTLPLAVITVFFVRLHSQADEVERAIHHSAAAHGFVFMMLAALVGMHLDRFDADWRLGAIHIWTVGMVAWLLGMLRALLRLR